MKKIWLGLLAGTFLLPAPMQAIAAPPTADQLAAQVEALTKQLEALKKQMAEMKAAQDKTSSTIETVSEKVEKSAKSLKSNLEFSGDYRFRVDSTRAHVTNYWNQMDVLTASNTMTQWNSAQLGQNLMPMMAMFPPALQQQLGGVMQQWDSMSQQQRFAVLNGMMGALTEQQRAAMMNMFGADMQKSYKTQNDLLYTNRLRLNMNAKPTENVEFKGRLSMYKIWGMESAEATAVPFGMNGFMYDPNITRRPNDNTVRVEMAYVNWSDIAGLPIWFSVGRRPTVDGPPNHLKYNYDKRYATPVALGVDWTFDGLTLGYQYSDPVPGKARICYGRGYEAGFANIPNTPSLNDTDLYGVSWDVIDDKSQNLFANVQLFKAADVPNYMEMRPINFPMLVDPGQPLPINDPLMSTAYKGYQVGDIYHLSGVFMHKIMGIDYFLSAGLSRTDNRFVDAYGMYPGLLNAPGQDDNHWGWAAFLGVRIPVEQLNSKIGLEYNHGSKYWISFTPASDDLYLSKLATRGDVAEVYWIYDIPDTPLTKFGKAFIRAGYQYYWIDYTGSGNWMGKPIKMEDTKSLLNAQQFAPVDHMDNFYATFEVFF